MNILTMFLLPPDDCILFSWIEYIERVRRHVDVRSCYVPTNIFFYNHFYFPLKDFERFRSTSFRTLHGTSPLKFVRIEQCNNNYTNLLFFKQLYT